MDAQLKAKWVEALRSGKYLQTQGILRNGEYFCCLGVLCDIQGADFEKIKNSYGTLSLTFTPPELLGSLGSKAEVLAKMNDSGSSFTEIADYIEANV